MLLKTAAAHMWYDSVRNSFQKLSTHNQKFPCDDSCFVKPQNDSSRPPLIEAARRPSLASMTLSSTAGGGGVFERMLIPEVCFQGIELAAPSLAGGVGEVGLVRSSSGSCSGTLWAGFTRARVRVQVRAHGGDRLESVWDPFVHCCAQRLYTTNGAQSSSSV